MLGAAVLLMVIALGVWLLVCRNKSDGLPAAETPADTGALRIALLPTAECLPIYVAESTGILDSLGLSTFIINARAQFDADTALYGHSVHLAASDLVRLQYQSSQGKKATALMALQGSWGLAVAPGRRAGGVKDLKDRLLGMARFAASDLYGLQALRTVDLEYDDMLRAQANDFSVRTNMVVQAQTEAAVLPEPYLTYATNQGARILWQVPVADTELGCLAAQPDVLFSKRRTAQLELLVKGYNQAVDRLNKRGLKGCDTLISQRYQLPVEVLQKAKLPRYHHASLPSATALTASRNFLSGRGVVLSGSMLMDDRFVAKK